MYETTGDLNEQIYYERLDVDMEMARFEEEGRRFAAREARARKLAATDHDAAIAACPHGGGYGLTGTAAENRGDPAAGGRYGDRGFRCGTCGGILDGEAVYGSVFGTVMEFLTDGDREYGARIARGEA